MHKSFIARFAKPLFGLFLLVSASTLTGCATSTQPSVVPYRPAPPPADLAAPCGALPELSSGDSQTLAAWIVDAAEQYRDCSARQAGLVRAWPGQSFSEALGLK